VHRRNPGANNGPPDPGIARLCRSEATSAKPIPVRITAAHSDSSVTVRSYPA
jgi:hypothetical protein